MPYRDEDKAREYRKEYYESNKNDIITKIVEYQKKNKDKRKKWSAKSYQKNKGKIKARIKKARATWDVVDNCPICGFVQSLVQDHDHANGFIRDFICSSCNLFLGHARENEEILKNGIRYINRWKKYPSGIKYRAHYKSVPRKRG